MVFSLELSTEDQLDLKYTMYRKMFLSQLIGWHDRDRANQVGDFKGVVAEIVTSAWYYVLPHPDCPESVGSGFSGY